LKELTMTVPIGTVISYMGPESSLASLGREWLLCDGSIVAQPDYPDLFAVIGGMYGQPGADTFTLPDLRGMFLRGVDPTGRVDPDCGSRGNYQGQQVGPVVGSWQWHQVVNHQHSWDGNFSSIGDGGDDIEVQLVTSNGVTGATTNVDGGGNETRPVNVYVYWLIYAGGSSGDSED
jgi:microcystin-dependent protein